MSLFSKMSESVKNYNEKQKELANIRGGLVLSASTDYVGGYDEAKGSTGVINIYNNQVEYRNIIIKEPDIKNVSIEGQDQASRRVTMTRLLLIGVFAFAAKKKRKDRETYLVFELVDGREVIFFFKDTPPMQMRAKLSTFSQGIRAK